MGCLCSKGTSTNDQANENGRRNKSSSGKEEVVVEVGTGKTDGSVHPMPNAEVEGNNVGSTNALKGTVEDNKNGNVEKSKSVHHQKKATPPDKGQSGGHSAHKGQQETTSPSRMPSGTEGEEIVAGWPSWLTSVAGEAVKGWTPRSADSYEKLNKVSSLTYFIKASSTML